MRLSPMLNTSAIRRSRDCWASWKWKKDLWDAVIQSPKEEISFRYWESINFITKNKYVRYIESRKEVQSATSTKKYWKLGCWHWKSKVQYLSHLVKQQLSNKFFIFVLKDVVLPKSPNGTIWKCHFS